MAEDDYHDSDDGVQALADERSSAKTMLVTELLIDINAFLRGVCGQGPLAEGLVLDDIGKLTLAIK